MILQAQQLARDLAAWLVKGITVNPTVVGIAAVAFAVLWAATARHGEQEPPQA